MTLRKSTEWIAVHCSATRPSQDIGSKEIDHMHRLRGFAMCGYHFVIRRNGKLECASLGFPTRLQVEIGAHVQGYNHNSIGVCMVGGLNEINPKIAENNYTSEQMATLTTLLQTLKGIYPKAVIQGHRDFSPDKNGDGVISPNERIKECPCFDVKPWVKLQRI